MRLLLRPIRGRGPARRGRGTVSRPGVAVHDGLRVHAQLAHSAREGAEDGRGSYGQREPRTERLTRELVSEVWAAC